MIKKTLFLIFSLLLVSVFVYLIYVNNRKDNFIDSGKLTAVTSFYPLYFFASQIAGDKAHIINLTPAGAEPHDYEPTAQDIAKIENSKLLILNGGKLEAWGDKIKDEISGKNIKVVVAGQD